MNTQPTYHPLAQYKDCALVGRDECTVCGWNKIDRPRALRRLTYLRQQIEGECISYGEIAELQGLADYIPRDDVLLLEWAGVPEDTTN